jgi:hypothetical protein
MRHLTWAVAFFALIGLGYAADQTILGKQVLVKDPKPGVDPTKRKVIGQGKESASPNSIVGDPMVDGAILTIFTEGATSANQVFNLATGTDPATGKPFWSGSSTGFTYKDKAGTNSAVTVAQIKRSNSGVFQIKVVAQAKNSPIALVPPNPGSAACILFEIGEGDRYHILLPPAPGSSIKKNDTKTFQIKDALTEGLCPETVTTTTPTSSSTTSTTSTTTTTSTTSSTTTTTTTTTTTQPPCGGVFPACAGSCPPGLHCGEDALSQCNCL